MARIGCCRRALYWLDRGLQNLNGVVGRLQRNKQLYRNKNDTYTLVAPKSILHCQPRLTVLTAQKNLHDINSRNSKPQTPFLIPPAAPNPESLHSISLTPSRVKPLNPELGSPILGSFLTKWRARVSRNTRNYGWEQKSSISLMSLDWYIPYYG